MKSVSMLFIYNYEFMTKLRCLDIIGFFARGLPFKNKTAEVNSAFHPSRVGESSTDYGGGGMLDTKNYVYMYAILGDFTLPLDTLSDMHWQTWEST